MAPPISEPSLTWCTFQMTTPESGSLLVRGGAVSSSALLVPVVGCEVLPLVRGGLT